ncbi:MAG: EpsG family protein [Niabella sp.]
MILYSLILVLLIFGVFNYDVQKRNIGKSAYFFFIFLVMTLMSGLRYRVGGDSLTYETYFNAMPILSEYSTFLETNYLNFQPLYVLFVSVCKTIKDDYYVYQFIQVVLINSILFSFIKKRSSYPFTTLLLLYIFLIYFYFSYEIQREIFAIAIFLLNFRNFEKNRWIRYYVFCILSFLFHISAVLLFFLPLFKVFKFNKWSIGAIILISIPLSFMKPILYSFLSVFFFLESMELKGQRYLEMNFSVLGFIVYYFIRVILLLPFVFFILKVKDTRYSWLVNAMFVISVFSQILVGVERFMNYLILMYIMCFVDYIYVTFHSARLKMAKLFMMYGTFLHLFFILDYKLIPTKTNEEYHYYSVYFPYSSIFSKEKNEDREKYIEQLWGY